MAILKVGEYMNGPFYEFTSEKLPEILTCLNDKYKYENFKIKEVDHYLIRIYHITRMFRVGFSFLYLSLLSSTQHKG